MNFGFFWEVNYNHESLLTLNGTEIELEGKGEVYVFKSQGISYQSSADNPDVHYIYYKYYIH